MNKAMQHLSASDKKLAGLIVRMGNIYRPWNRGSAFNALVEIIIGQQLSGRAAKTIHNRVKAFNGNRALTAAALQKITDLDLRSAGVSRPKIASLRSLADAVASHRLGLRRLKTMSDEEARIALMAVKGVGPWSVQMFLMFHLERLDIFAGGDLGIQKAMLRLYGVEQKSPRFQKISDRWRPYRTVACWYLWRSLSWKK